MVTKADAVRRENATERKRNRRKRRPSIATLRIADLNRLFIGRYGNVLPDDDAGRDDVAIMAHHLVTLAGNPETRIAEWCRLRAPWLTITELADITADAIRRPRRWKADRLAWRLRLTEADRKSLRITTIGAIDCGKDARATSRRATQRARMEAARRVKGAKPRHEYEANALNRLKPWLAAGISRAQWYRRRVK